MSWLHRPIRLLASLLLALPVVSAPARDASLAPYRAEYEVLRNGKAIGSSTTELVRQGETWTWRSRTTGERGMAWMVGLSIEQSTDFRWVDGEAQPLHTRYRQEATLGSRRVDVDYDWQAMRYRLVDRKGEHRHGLQPGATDRYGSTIAVATRLARGETDFVLKVAHADGLHDWRFRVTSEEDVDTPAGRVRALRVERVREGRDRLTVTWVDPARSYVVVRMLQEEDGERTESRLRSYSPR